MMFSATGMQQSLLLVGWAVGWKPSSVGGFDRRRSNGRVSRGGEDGKR
jgi:hypothetical protein